MAGAFFTVPVSFAQTDVTSPTDPVQVVSGPFDDDGQVGPPPLNEGVDKAIDNTMTKYLNFIDEGSGLIVTPGAGSTVINSMRIYTANDFPDRDPASYLLEGSNNAGSSWTVISTGTLNLPANRNATGQPISTPGLFSQTVSFFNLMAYTSYRITFPTIKDVILANSMQIGEIELLDIPVSAATVTVAGRVSSSVGRGVASARVSFTNQNGETQMALTNAFGYFRFAGVEAGETYIFTATHKRYQFTPQVVTLLDTLSDLNFVAEP
ncbi:MAG: carboxypeptidase regulatory-like domain-containing protein [Saprospiraceae bacterium]|nr:carboxypeptidase regulatory-like domain-containing protein [Pyrinomonadaceae bacterium]